MSKTPQIHFDDDKPHVSDGWIEIALVSGIVLVIAAALIVGLSGCASATDHATDAALPAVAAGAGAAFGGPVVAMIVTFIVSLFTGLTGGSSGADGVAIALGRFARIGNFIDHWLWPCIGVVIALCLYSRRFRKVVGMGISGLWRAPAAMLRGDGAEAKEAAVDVVASPLRVVGMAAEDPPPRAYDRYRAQGRAEGWIDPKTGDRREVPTGWVNLVTGKAKT